MSDSGRRVIASFLIFVVLASAAAAATSTGARPAAAGPAEDETVAVASAYNAMPVALAGRDVRLPLWRNGHTVYRFTTPVAVTNVGAGEAAVTMTVTLATGETYGASATIAPGGTHHWWPADIPGVPSDARTAYGTARIVSSQPVVAAVMDLTLAPEDARMLDLAAYSGMAADADPPESNPRAAAIPLALGGGGSARRLAGAGGSAPPAGISGAGQTGIMIQNLDPDARAEVALDLFPQSGSAPTQLMAQAPAGGVANFYLPSLAIRDGAYAALASSDRTIAALARTDWPSRGGAAVYDGPLPSTDVVLALLAKEYRNHCSLVTIQNTDVTDQAVATVEFYSSAGGTPLLARDYPVSRGTSITLRLCDDADLLATLPGHFFGSMRVRSRDGHARFGVLSLGDVFTSDKAVYAHEGVPAELADRLLYAPMVHARWDAGGADPLWRLTSRIAVASVDTVPLDVRVHYEGIGGTCAGARMEQGPVALQPNGVADLDPSGDGVLPDGCLAGARIESSGRVAAVVVDEGSALLRPTPTPSPTDAPSATATPTETGVPTPITPFPPDPGHAFRLLDVQAAAGEGSNVQDMAVLRDRVYFNANDGESPSALWSTDGTRPGTRRVSGAAVVGCDKAPGGVAVGDPELTALGDRLYFRGCSAEGRVGLWYSDGTEAGTGMVADINEADQNSLPHDLVAWRGRLFFAATDGNRDRELWTVDGTTGATTRLADIAPGPTDSGTPHDLTVAGDRLFFAADDGVHGWELWSTDGTSGGTRMVKDLVQDAEGSDPELLTAMGGRVYFVTFNRTLGTVLWTSDGTDVGTTMVRSFTGDRSSGARERSVTWMAERGGRLYLDPHDGDHGSELWSSDGTPEGTRLVADIAAGRRSSAPALLGRLGDALVVSADDGVHGREAWITDGSAVGAHLLADLARWTAGGFDVESGGCRELAGRLYCAATDGVLGVEPTVIDVDGGVRILRDLHPGHWDSSPSFRLAWGGKLFLTADDGVHGNEPWVLTVGGAASRAIYLPYAARRRAIAD